MVWIGVIIAPTAGDSFEGLLQEHKEPPSTLLVYDDIALVGISSVYYKDPAFLALRDKIIQCESEWNPLAQNPKSTAHGLGQFLDSTWLMVQERWNKAFERDSYRDQLYAMTRLLEEDGTIHWISSQYCWQS